MNIRARMLLFQGVVVSAIAALAVAAFLLLHSADYTRERIRLANQELDAMMQIAVSANRYSEQIAEMLVLGEAERPELDGARSQFLEAFSRLDRLIEAEIALVSDPAEKGAERRELERLNRMRSLFEEVDRTVERLLLLERDGDRAGAIAVLRFEIENRLDAELEGLIAEGVAGERAEVARVESNAAILASWLRLATITISAALAVLTLVIGMTFTLSLVRPIADLTAGARAIADGYLDHRIGHVGRNEVGVLARSFNDMASKLGRQHADLVAARAGLEHQVERRTEELEQANRRLSLVDRQRVRFLADASHELRTPLTVLRGEAEVALRGGRKPQRAYRRALERIVDQAADMGRLVDDLLFLARSEAEEIRFDYRTVGLRSIVSDAVREASALAHEDQFVVDPEEPDGEPMVRADPRWLKQAVLIVIDNAIKYSAPGAPIRVRLRAVGGARAVVAVSDRGPGIPPDELPRVFDRFYRGENARGAGINGSGLGLAIAKWIMEKHGGEIALSSTSVGTTVEMSLPVAG
jgi:two-component system OmpR family sensor kinase